MTQDVAAPAPDHDRMTTLTSEIRRNIQIETLCTLKGTKGEFPGPEQFVAPAHSLAGGINQHENGCRVVVSDDIQNPARPTPAPNQVSPGATQSPERSGPGQNQASPGSLPFPWPLPLASATRVCPAGTTPYQETHAAGR